ncbi:TetR/AcrR family transcriptional regulator [Cellulosimicrobium composti]|nr:helix-turn-helix domain-containing protein [Cellulosimicrobium composti]
MTGASGHMRDAAAPPAAARTRMPRDARRAQLLAIAEELFASQGYHHISMDDIADRAGVGKPVLYRHFPSKLDLYLAIVDEQGERLVRAVHTTLDPFREPAPGVEAGDLDALAVDGLAVLEGIVRAYVAYACTAGRSAALLFESDVMRDPVVRARVLEPDARIAGAFADVLVRIADLDAGEALVVARTCTAVGRAAATEVVRPDGATADDVTRLVPRLVWRGVHGMLRRSRPSADAQDDAAALDGSAAGI